MKIIEVQLSEKQFINASMILLAKKPITWILPLISLLFLMLVLPKENQRSNSSAAPFFVTAAILYSIFLPVFTLYRAKKLYNQRSSRTREKVSYEIQDNLISIRGETFLYESNWINIYKVTATKNWIFIWTNSLSPSPVPKSAIWEGELMRLREILDANKIPHNIQ